MSEGEGAFPDILLSESSTGGCVDEREMTLYLRVFEDVREGRLLDEWDGGPRRPVDGEGGHDDGNRRYSERSLAMSAIGVKYTCLLTVLERVADITHQLLCGFNPAWYRSRSDKPHPRISLYH